LKKKSILWLVFAVLIVLIPLVLMIFFQERNNLYKETEDYVEYLYFNWIDYPAKAEKNDNLSEDANEEVFKWFGYDENGEPIIECYSNIDFKYNGSFIREKNYIAVPFENGNKTYYRKLIINDGKITAVSDSVWE